MNFPYKKVLILGATSGIGEALAIKFVETGTPVIVTGRRKENLENFVKHHGSSGKVDSMVFDITQLDQIPKFAADMFTKHPDLDCVFLNSGIQRMFDWSKPDQIDLDLMTTELNTNYTSYMHITKAFLPYLQKQAPEPTSLIFTTSGLALIPLVRCPNYSATKAALHHMILAMREQLKAAKSNVRIIELLPPAVQTELHDEKHQPDIKDGRSIGMPLKDFTEEAFEGLCKDGTDGEHIPVQAVKSFMGYYDWEQERQKTMHKMNAFMR